MSDERDVAKQVIYATLTDILRTSPTLRADGGIEVEAVLYPDVITMAVLDALQAKHIAVVDLLRPRIEWETPFGPKVVAGRGEVYDEESGGYMDPEEARALGAIYLAAAEQSEVSS